MHMYLSLFFLFTSVSLIATPLDTASNTPRSEEETLFLQRIADFWEEEEYEIAKTQIESFLNAFPQSAYQPLLLTALGDLLFKKGLYESALEYYHQLPKDSPEEGHVLRKAQCFYELQRYDSLIQEVSPLLPSLDLSQTAKERLTYLLAESLCQKMQKTELSSEETKQIATSAYPLCLSLLSTEFAPSLAGSLGEICTLLEKYSEGTEAFLQLSRDYPEQEEAYRFQAALFAAKHNPEKALDLFKGLSDSTGEHAQQALYNELSLLSHLNRHEELLCQKERFLAEIPPQQLPKAQLLIAKSHLTLKQYDAAIQDLQTLLQAPTEPPLLKETLSLLAEASFLEKHLQGLQAAIDAFSESFPEEDALVKMRFSKALLLKQNNHPKKAEAELQELLGFSQSQQKPLILFELAHLAHSCGHLEACYSYCKTFLSEFGSHDLASYTWHYLLTSSLTVRSKQEFAQDLQSYLQLPLSQNASSVEWSLLLAKTYLELKESDQCKTLAEKLLSGPLSSSQKANITLLLGMCDQQSNPSRFCALSEEALFTEPTLISKGHLHLALYNAYLKDPLYQEQSIGHLYQAIRLGAVQQTEPLVGLADFYWNQIQEELDSPQNVLSDAAQRALDLYLQVAKLSHPSCPTHAQAAYRAGRIYSALGQPQQTVELLLPVSQEGPLHKEILYQLGLAYLDLDQSTEALKLFQRLSETSSIAKDTPTAGAKLQLVRLLLKEPVKKETSLTFLQQLKDLSLQTGFCSEPIALEAALDYLAFHKQLYQDSTEKQIALLKKTHQKFQKTPTSYKSKIQEEYLQFMHAQILLLEGDLVQDREKTEQAHHLFEEIARRRVHPLLVNRAQTQLGQLPITYATDS